MTTRNKILVAFAGIVMLAMLFTGCQDKPVYSHYVPVQPSGWVADSTLCFEFEITDTVPDYRVLLHVRHDNNYPYQNMWVFVDITDPAMHTTTDTIEFFLADQRGRWLGGGAGNIKTMPVIISDDRQFELKGEYRLYVRHGMRTDKLCGIQDIGVELYVKK